ncbi:MAG: ABC transporter ATP-binding protein [Geminicoccaceae bacterium]
MMAVLEVRDLTKSFGGVIAVDHVDFDLHEGELLALIGPNGAGKTTCFNMLNGQLKPDAGAITFAGRSLVGLSPRRIWRLGVGRTFQITATFASMTVRENVQMALISRRRELFKAWRAAAGRHVEEAEALLQKVGMADQAERAASVLAYGDLKRLELAIALANGPKLLLMDEPTAGMAPKERAELMRLIAGIVAGEGISVLFTEHDMDVVFEHAHRIMVLNRGALIAEGTAAEVRSNALVREVYLGGGAMFDDAADGRGG